MFLPTGQLIIIILNKFSKHVIRKGAEAALQFYRKSDDVSADMEEMETESAAKTDRSDESFTMKELFTTTQLRIPLLIAVMLQVKIILKPNIVQYRWPSVHRLYE